MDGGIPATKTPRFCLSSLSPTLSNFPTCKAEGEKSSGGVTAPHSEESHGDDGGDGSSNGLT